MIISYKECVIEQQLQFYGCLAPGKTCEALPLPSLWWVKNSLCRRPSVMFRCPLRASSPLFININPSERPMTGDPIGVLQPAPSGLHRSQVLVSHYVFYALVMSFCCNYLCLLNVGYYLFFIHGLPFTAQMEQSAPKRPRLDDPPPLAGPLDTSWVCILLVFYHSVPFSCSNYYNPCCCRKFFFSFYA